MYQLTAPLSIRIYIHTHTHMCIYELTIFSIFGTPLTVGPFRFLIVVVIVAVNDFVYEYTYKMLPSMRQVTHQPYNHPGQAVGEYVYVICSYRSGENIGCTLLYVQLAFKLSVCCEMKVFVCSLLSWLFDLVSSFGVNKANKSKKFASTT